MMDESKNMKQDVCTKWESTPSPAQHWIGRLGVDFVCTFGLICQERVTLEKTEVSAWLTMVLVQQIVRWHTFF